MQVGSFGVNGHVKLPGPTQHQPNVYNFGTPYHVIYKDLRSKDEAFYEQKGLLQVGSFFFWSHTVDVVKCMVQTWLSAVQHQRRSLRGLAVPIWCKLFTA